jgi:hypothetical protein
MATRDAIAATSNAERTTPLSSATKIKSARQNRVHRLRRHVTLWYKVTVLELLRRPTGFVPLLISLGFLAAFLVGLMQGTLVRRPDEDAEAHLFQILMLVQFLIITFFAITWLPRRPGAAFQVLALQIVAAGAVLAIVYARHL